MRPHTDLLLVTAEEDVARLESEQPPLVMASAKLALRFLPGSPFPLKSSHSPLLSLE